MHSLARTSMCVLVLDVCCGKLLTGYLGWPPINGLISIKLLGRVKFGKLSASFSSLKWFEPVTSDFGCFKKIYWYHEMAISLQLKKGHGQFYQLLYLRTTHFRGGGQTIPSFLNLSRNWFVAIFWMSCILWYEILSPSAANFSKDDFFLVLARTRSPIFTGRWSSLDLESFKIPSHLHFVLTALNRSNWARSVTTVSAFSIVVSLLSIRDTTFNKGSGTDVFCSC